MTAPLHVQFVVLGVDKRKESCVCVQAVLVRFCNETCQRTHWLERGHRQAGKELRAHAQGQGQGQLAVHVQQQQHLR